MKSRLERFREILASAGVDAVIISQPENRRYLSGFTGSAGYLLIGPNLAVLATDFRYIEQAVQEAPEFEVWRIDGSLVPALRDLVRKHGVRRLGFEAHAVTYQTYREWSRHLRGRGVRLVPLRGLAEQLRMVKDDAEVSLIRRAAEITDQALAAVLSNLKFGLTERELAWQIERTMRELGADGPAFRPIVATGPNAARPHHPPGDRRIQPGDIVLIDIGAGFGGYQSDLTRTFVFGRADEKFLEVWRIVAEANEAARRAARPGVSAAEVDAAAREVIRAAGYGENFGHGLGHGVGLVIHEGPRLGPKSEDRLAAGMVFTIEPGIYLPGWGGVRIEDLVVLRDHGVEVISQSPRFPVLEI